MLLAAGANPDAPSNKKNAHGIGFKTMAQVIAEKWNVEDIDPHEKQLFEEMAAREKKRYNEEMEDYRRRRQILRDQGLLPDPKKNRKKKAPLKKPPPPPPEPAPQLSFAPPPEPAPQLSFAPPQQQTPIYADIQPLLPTSSGPESPQAAAVCSNMGLLGNHQSTPAGAASNNHKHESEQSVGSHKSGSSASLASMIAKIPMEAMDAPIPPEPQQQRQLQQQQQQQQQQRPIPQEQASQFASVAAPVSAAQVQGAEPQQLQSAQYEQQRQQLEAQVRAYQQQLQQLQQQTLHGHILQNGNLAMGLVQDAQQGQQQQSLPPTDTAQQGVENESGDPAPDTLAAQQEAGVLTQNLDDECADFLVGLFNRPDEGGGTEQDGDFYHNYSGF